MIRRESRGDCSIQRRLLTGALLCVGLSSADLLAQGRATAVEYPSVRILDSRQGLSNNSAFSLLQDHQGFLWIGTIDGLNRIDGYSFTIYRHDPNHTHSLSNTTVREIREDRWRNLWLATAAGLDRFDRRTGRFHHYAIDVQQLGLDLHDNLGSQVATMVAGIELAQMTAKAGNREVVDKQLATLKHEAQRTMEQLHETVWSLHHERVTLAALADQVDEHLRDRQRYVQEPRLRFQSAGDLDRELPSSHALHLFRIVLPMGRPRPDR